ncbi:hypothetical protein QTO34_001876 [Cnephaeus nilssonii]|uniref:Uncharacterized protein n=1 Tax=Cnephaeus nilssonii TaxID=3371016 RepID=A0AA40HTV1_CNENI|nr:hypothetical protein QTO34_001876 [Eptesicus nilssonii]
MLHACCPGGTEGTVCRHLVAVGAAIFEGVTNKEKAEQHHRPLSRPAATAGQPVSLTAIPGSCPAATTRHPADMEKVLVVWVEDHTSHNIGPKWAWRKLAADVVDIAGELELTRSLKMRLKCWNLRMKLNEESLLMDAQRK